MVFQASLDTIPAKTGQGPRELTHLAEEKGLLKAGTKAGQVVAWLNKNFAHGHAMAIYTFVNDGERL